MDGRLVLIAMLGGNTVEKADLLPIMLRRLHGDRQHHAPAHHRAEGRHRRGAEGQAWPLLEAGQMRAA